MDTIEQSGTQSISFPAPRGLTQCVFCSDKCSETVWKKVHSQFTRHAQGFCIHKCGWKNPTLLSTSVCITPGPPAPVCVCVCFPVHCTLTQLPASPVT